MEAEFGGVKFKGGKIFGLLIALSTLVGGLYGGFVAYKDYTDFKNFIENEYVTPDLSGFDKRIDLVQQEIEIISGEMSMMLSEIETMVNNIKNNVRDELRLFENSIKELELDLDLKIDKALNNPLTMGNK